MRFEATQRAAWVYTAALLTLYPLYVPAVGYVRILDAKFDCFALLTLLFVLYAAVCGAKLPTLRPARDDLPALAFGALALASALASPYGVTVWLGDTHAQGFVSLALYVLLFYLLRRFLHPDRTLLALAALSATVCDLVVLLQLTGRNPLSLYPAGLSYYDGDVAYAGFYAGTAGNADFTAFLLALALCAMAMALVRLRRRALFCIVPAALTLYVLVRLNVSGAWVGLGAAAVFSLPLALPGHRRAAFGGVLALTFAALALVWFCPASGGALYEASELLHGRADPSFGSGRLAIWRQLPPLIAERPLLGGGPDTLGARALAPFVEYVGGTAREIAITSAHNEYLAAAVNLGLPALGCELALLLRALLRAYRRAEDESFAVCGAALVCYLAMALFSVDTPVTAPYLPLLLAILLPEKPAGFF